MLDDSVGIADSDSGALVFARGVENFAMVNNNGVTAQTTTRSNPTECFAELGVRVGQEELCIDEIVSPDIQSLSRETSDKGD